MASPAVSQHGNGNGTGTTASSVYPGSPMAMAGIQSQSPAPTPPPAVQRAPSTSAPPAGHPGSSSSAVAPGTSAGYPPFKYTSMIGVSGALQSKNMSSTFMKDDRQSYWARREGDTSRVMHDLREKKRRRVLNDGSDRKPDGTNGAGRLDAPDMEVDVDVKGKGRESQAPSSASLVDPSNVIIIHPGSRNLRIGRASDNIPYEVPGCIARRIIKAPLGDTNGHPSSTDEGESGPRYKELSEEKLEILRLDLRARMRILKLRGTSGGSLAAAEYNRTVVPEDVPPEFDEAPIEWTDPMAEGGKDVYFGDEALNIPEPEKSGWKVRWPILKGGFNTEAYETAQELLGDIQAILLDALQRYCEVHEKDLEQYSVILLIQDLYEYTYVQEMSDLLLRTMGFAQLIVHQEGLSATFAAGMPSACVVDLGARKAAVSCIDEGMVIADSRMLLDFGGDDMLETFAQVVLQTVEFPYKELDLARSADWEMMERLFAKAGAFNEHNFGVNTYDFVVRKPGRTPKRFSMKMHDEVILPTFCFWAPRILDWERKHAPSSQTASPKQLWAPRDDFEEIIEIGGGAVTAAMKKSVQHLTQPRAFGNNLSVPGDGGQTGDGPFTPALMPGQSDVVPPPAEVDAFASPAPVGAAMAPSASSTGTPGGSITKAGTPTPLDAAAQQPVSTVDHARESSKLPLDVAIFESLTSAGGDDKVKRVTTNILVIGGVANIQGVGFAIQTRLEPLMRQKFPSGPSPLVIPSNKYADPAHLAWKGISSLCKLDVVNDMWVRKDDWELMNMRTLRDRSFFVIA